MQTDDYKLIDQYLRGELDEATQEQVRARLSSDEAFAEELEFQQEIKGFVAHREGRKKLEEQLKQLRSEASKSGGSGSIAAPATKEPTAKIVPLRRRILYVVGVAAAIAVVVFFAWPYLMPGSLYDQFNDHQVLALQERGDLDELITEAETAFNDGDFEAAYTKLTEFSQSNGDDVRAQLALGIAALETDRLAEAKAIFASLSSGQSAVKDNASWYLALAYVKEGDLERARNILNGIPEGTFWAGKAQELLEQL
jgi:tetratricopeptide (TPR) repeat protein